MLLCTNCYGDFSILETSVFDFHFLNSCCSETVVVDFVEICNVCIRKAIIKAAKKIFNSDKICDSYSLFLEHSVFTCAQKLTNRQFKADTHYPYIRPIHTGHIYGPYPYVQAVCMDSAYQP